VSAAGLDSNPEPWDDDDCATAAGSHILWQPALPKLEGFAKNVFVFTKQPNDGSYLTVSIHDWIKGKYAFGSRLAQQLVRGKIKFLGWATTITLAWLLDQGRLIGRDGSVL
jgi:hypothetical protein